MCLLQFFVAGWNFVHIYIYDGRKEDAGEANGRTAGCGAILDPGHSQRPVVFFFEPCPALVFCRLLGLAHALVSVRANKPRRKTQQIARLPSARSSLFQVKNMKTLAEALEVFTSEEVVSFKWDKEVNGDTGKHTHSLEAL